MTYASPSWPLQSCLKLSFLSSKHSPSMREWTMWSERGKCHYLKPTFLTFRIGKIINSMRGIAGLVPGNSYTSQRKLFPSTRLLLFDVRSPPCTVPARRICGNKDMMHNAKVPWPNTSLPLPPLLFFLMSVSLTLSIPSFASPRWHKTNNNKNVGLTEWKRYAIMLISCATKDILVKKRWPGHYLLFLFEMHPERYKTTQEPLPSREWRCGGWKRKMKATRQLLSFRRVSVNNGHPLSPSPSFSSSLSFLSASVVGVYELNPLCPFSHSCSLSTTPHFLHAASAPLALAEIIFILHDVTAYVEIALLHQKLFTPLFPPMNSQKFTLVTSVIIKWAFYGKKK